MTEKKTSLFENGLIWFGAAVSIAEIMTGTYFAPLGFTKGLFAIIVGHIIGCFLLFLAGVIGGKTRKSSMETVKLSFGKKGSVVFTVLNLIQLVSWTAIMIFDGAIAANGILDIGHYIWCILIGGLIIIWVLVGIKNLGKLNTATMSALFILGIILSIVIFSGEKLQTSYSEAITFGSALELSIAMPLSWLPLISDYTKEAEKPVKASLVSAVTYGTVSSWMYIIGLGGAIFTGENDITQIILKSGVGIAGLVVVVISTGTTTFMDAYSAGESAESIFKRVNTKTVAVLTAVIGIAVAALFPIGNITDFLYFIGSVFAPMIAIMLADFFVVKNDSSDNNFNAKNIIVWFIGFILYRVLMHVDIIVGSTIPAMAITFLLTVFVNKRGSVN